MGSRSELTRTSASAQYYYISYVWYVLEYLMRWTIVAAQNFGPVASFRAGAGCPTGQAAESIATDSAPRMDGTSDAAGPHWPCNIESR